MPALSSGSFLICMFINIILCVFICAFMKLLAPNGLPYTFFVTKEYQKYQVMGKQRSLYTSILATNIRQSHGFVQF